MMDLMPLDAWSIALRQTAFSLGFLLVGLSFYSGLADLAIFENRGLVRSQVFGPLDLLIGGTLATLFALLIVGGWHDANSPAAAHAPLPSAGAMIVSVSVSTLVTLAIMLGIIASLSRRRIDWLGTFGFTRLTPVSLLVRTPVLLFCALPLIGAALGISHVVFEAGKSEDASAQEIVRFLAYSRSDVARSVVVFSAIILAPLQEEFIFRGYIYGVLRRYVGVPAGILVNAALFAGIHLHAPSFAGLFVLAVCLTLAYEWTGSLLVPMAMHGLFNSLSILNLFLGGNGG